MEEDCQQRQQSNAKKSPEPKKSEMSRKSTTARSERQSTSKQNNQPPTSPMSRKSSSAVSRDLDSKRSSSKLRLGPKLDNDSRNSITVHSEEQTTNQQNNQPPTSPMSRKSSAAASSDAGSRKSTSKQPPASTASIDAVSRKSSTKQLPASTASSDAGSKMSSSKQLPDRDEFNQLRRNIKELAAEFEAESKQIKSMLQESLGMSEQGQAVSADREQALSVLAEDELSDAMTLLGSSLEYLVRGARQEKKDLLAALGGSLIGSQWPEERTASLMGGLQPPTLTPPADSGYPSSLEMSELLRHIGLLATELHAQNERISQTFQGRVMGSSSASLPLPSPSPRPGAAAAAPTYQQEPEQLPLASPFFGLQQGIVSLTKLIQEDSQRLSNFLPPSLQTGADLSAPPDMPPLVSGLGNPLQQEVMATGASVMSRLHELSSVYADRVGGEAAVVASTPLVEAVIEVSHFVDTLARQVHELKQHKSNERRAHFAQSMRVALEQLTTQVGELAQGMAGLEKTRFQECIEQQQALVAKLTIPDPALLAVLKQVKDAVRRLGTGVMEMKLRQDQLLEKYSHPQSLPFEELGVGRMLASNGGEGHPSSVLTDVHGVEEETMLKSLRDLRESVAYVGRELQEADLKKRNQPPKLPEVPPTDPNVLKALSALRESVKSIHPRRKNGTSSSSSSSDTLNIK